MENAGVQKKETGDSASVFSTVWDPFWFMRQVMGWGRSGDAASFDVKETNETFVCKFKVKLALPAHADVAHVKAELDDGELTLVVPKAAAPPEPASPRKRTGKGRGSATRTSRRGARARARPR